MNLLKILFGPKKLLSSEIEHINKEMYKKSAELNEKNKTLSLLQELDHIILGSITHLNEIAQLVTSLLVNDANFESVTIFLLNKEEKVLQRLAFSETPKPLQINYFSSIPISQIDNVIVQAVNDKARKRLSLVANTLLSNEEFAKPEVQQSLSHIKSVHIFPLIVRNDLLGVLVLCLAEEENALSEYRKDLLDRLADIIGIALDNSILYNQVQEANERLKQLDRLKDDFVSVASHELRTPMTAIKSYLWMALDGQGGPLNDKQKYYVDRSYASVERLIKLVNDMLNISRIESGRLSVEMSSVDIVKLVKDVVEEVGPRAKELGVSVDVEVGNDAPMVLADADKIKEVMYNLIGNSMKFSERGGKINVLISKKEKQVEVEIRDAGAGIDAEDLPKLFQKFGILPGSYITNQPTLGTGLGLYICRSLVELHTGKIWAASEGKGKGATFTFSLKEFNKEELEEINKKYKQSDVKVGLISSKIL